MHIKRSYKPPPRQVEKDKAGNVVFTFVEGKIRTGFERPVTRTPPGTLVANLCLLVLVRKCVT